ncbi:Versicolorin B synthase [Cytospora mali]|uniref:Versicolorin B synthase n=1 Tax=Cytospora mali TaxID=578113 RepID=A0A194V315_CYTMA|nr:Versicolorin B synthase [Valsa mali var. pyri (nom. inval.)]
MALSQSRIALSAVLFLVLLQCVYASANSSCSISGLGSSFDYVIVGGGTGGLVVANRLTENQNVTVAVIEAGTYPENVHGNWTQVPFYQSRFVNNTDPMMWDFTMQPQIGVDNISFPYYRAKALGGCSDVNAMAYTHTCAGAHQLWADTVGDQSYTYDNMLTFYHKTMDFTPPNNQDRGANVTTQYDISDTVTGGVLSVTFANYVQSWATWLTLGLETIGVHKVDSFIDGNLLGQAYNMDTINQSDSFRSSSESAYLRPVLARPNLAVFDYTLAQKVIFNDKNEATGVLVNDSCTITARKEVILSAGFVQSPRLLLVSGVGPRSLLNSLDIPVVAELPGVGQNLKDQAATFISYQVNLLTGTELSVNSSYLEEAISEFNTNASGPLSSPGGDLYSTEIIPKKLRANWSAEVNDTLAQLPADWPHIGYAAYPSVGEGTAAITLDPTGNYASVLIILQALSSTGYVSISSANISDPPVIDPKLLTNDADVAILIAGIKRMRAAFGSSAVQPILIGSEVLPGEIYQTDDEIETYLRKTTYSMSHGFGTCKMGKVNDTMAVVDTHGSVYGVKNYTLAEKLSQDIKDTTY